MHGVRISEASLSENHLVKPFKEDISLQKVKPLAPQRKLKLLSLFSGCGGLDLGFLGGFDFRGRQFNKTSFDLVFSNDNDPGAALVYQKNKDFFSHDILEKDISLIKENEIPDFDFLTAGFPCQPFSNAGLRKGIKDDRGSFFSDAIRIFSSSIKGGKRPLGFLFENVRGIMSSKMPDGTLIPDEIVKRMEKLGYCTSYKLLKASDYGVPSNRYRLILVGFRKDLGYFDFSLLEQIVEKYTLPNVKNSAYDLLLGSVLCDIPKNAGQREDYWKYSPSGQHMVDSIGSCIDGMEALKKFKNKVPLAEISETISKGKSWKSMAYKDMSPRFKRIWDNPKKYRAPNFYRRFALGEINGTITASGQPENCGITHPFLNRRFTVREIARIQSFPDNFNFPYSNISHAYKVIGNAVPPVLAWVLARAIEEHLGSGVSGQ